MPEELPVPPPADPIPPPSRPPTPGEIVPPDDANRSRARRRPDIDPPPGKPPVAEPDVDSERRLLFRVP